ncbi:hypothetical protein PYW08_005223 [Mythimna loreyi]|uniref:Uncharacterized protein n=1 Tax=Mythimna loreyi TaxID=667449 RepID=A0ACC2QH33_9NEOP|nr:hypothetical protein PYW08_005223 [Mythimna loreyi]
MYLKLGIAIGTSLLLASADHPDSHYICTSLSELAHPCGCAFSNDTFDPQCGSDGVTYLNACFLECQNLVHTTQVAVVHAGVCEHHFNCECHTVYKPVCGSDGVTYSNDCTLKCATERNSSIVLSHAGVCDVNDDKQEYVTETTARRKKAFDYSPWLVGTLLHICIAIGTSLLLASANLPVPDFACTSYTDVFVPCGCPFSKETFDPQCGSDGETYLNACSMECHKIVLGNESSEITVAHAGVCEHEFKCECHTDYEPVCGSNGNTYSNECTLKCATDRDSSIVLSHVGVCKAKGKGIGTAENLFGPKDNKCRNRGKCRKKTKDRRQFREYSYESSEGEQEFMRPSDENFPMPDINIEHHYKTTPKTTTETKILSGYEGPCVCTEVHRPVCASNKRTYANFCVLLCSSKIDPTIKLAHWGDCEMAKTTTTTPTPNDKNNKKSLNKETPDKHNHDNKKPTNHPTKKKCICAAVHWPICASNRKTYPNYCVFLCDQRKDHALHLLYWRECSERNDDYYQ